jgi:4-hydroxy-tetrahydrodipicolinate synthase
MPFEGLFTALITPFLREGGLDEEGLRHLIHRQIQAGVDGILLLGTTGEAATLNDAEQARVIQIGVEETRGQTRLIIGTGSNSTSAAIEKTRRAHALGADAALVIAPYYNKPTQEGLYLHYQAISSSTSLPLIIYNHPGRTGVNIETATLYKIATLPSVVGIKECSGNFTQVSDLLSSLSLPILSGDDPLALPLIALGCRGLISVASNLFPERLVSLVSAASMGQLESAQALHKELHPFFRLCFIETNPIPIKHALNLASLPAGPCRLPLSPLKPAHQESLQRYLFSEAARL